MEEKMMERFSDTAIDIINNLHTERLDYNSEYCPLIDAAYALKEYEDTGVSVPEIREMIKRLEQSEPPCKVGDTINHFGWSESRGNYVVSDKVTSITINKSGYTIRTKSKFYPIKKDDDFTFAPISEYPLAFADYYIGSQEEAEAVLKGKK